MTLLIKFRAIWITIIAWFIAITLNQIMRGYPIIPPGVTTTGYIAIHLTIGTFIGAIFWLIGGIASTMRNGK